MSLNISNHTIIEIPTKCLAYSVLLTFDEYILEEKCYETREEDDREEYSNRNEYLVRSEKIATQENQESSKKNRRSP
jgi:hypothetical protein